MTPRPMAIRAVRRRRRPQEGAVRRRHAPAPRWHLGLYPIVTFRYSSSVLYQFPYHTQ
jgi:hypothetical protein